MFNERLIFDVTFTMRDREVGCFEGSYFPTFSSTIWKYQKCTNKGDHSDKVCFYVVVGSTNNDASNG